VSTFEIQRSAERPAIPYTFTQGGNAVPLTGNQGVTFKARDVAGTAIAFSGAGTVTSADDGQVAYTFGTADTAVVGEYVGWFDVAFPDGNMTSPPFDLRIIDAAQPYRGGAGCRPGMPGLVALVRDLIDDAEGPENAWTNHAIQQALDRTAWPCFDDEVEPILERGANGTAVWRHFKLPHRYYEAGTAFVVHDAYGSVPSWVSALSLDWENGWLHSPTDLMGSAVFVTAKTYDPPCAAADMIEKLIGRYALAYDVSMDGQSFSRSQVIANLSRRAKDLRAQGRIGSAHLHRSDSIPAPEDRRWRRGRYR
jgi:hypothetical protein